MKKCPVCNEIDIEEKYAMCMKCLKEGGQLQILKDIHQSLEFINWNAGIISKVLKFYLIIELEKYGSGRTENQEKIYQFLVQYLDKDLKAAKDIKKEEEKKATPK